MTNASISILRQLIAFDTTSRNSNLSLIEWVANHLSGCGAQVELIYDSERSKANLLGSLGPAREGGIVLSGHTDVVPVDDQEWTGDPFSLQERDGRLYGRGAADMKGFIACALAAASRWQSRAMQRPIHFALSYDEEVGCLGAHSLVDRISGSIPRPAFAIVGEPTDMRIGIAHNGVTGEHTRFRGCAAHASDPSLGVNAIEAAAAFVCFLSGVAKLPEIAGSGCTLNIGRISGGSATNIVAERCSMHWEYRTCGQRQLTVIRNLVGEYLGGNGLAALQVAREIELEVPYFCSNLDEQTLRELTKLGAKLPLATLPFGSEAGIFELRQIPTVICGPGSINQAHRPDEWIARAALEEADRFLEGVITWASSTTPA